MIQHWLGPQPLVCSCLSPRVALSAPEDRNRNCARGIAPGAAVMCLGRAVAQRPREEPARAGRRRRRRGAHARQGARKPSARRIRSTVKLSCRVKSTGAVPARRDPGLEVVGEIFPPPFAHRKPSRPACLRAGVEPCVAGALVPPLVVPIVAAETSASAAP